MTGLDKISADMVKITSDSAYVRDDLIREFVLFTSRLDPLLPTMPEPEPEPAGGTPTGPDEPGGDVPGGDLPG